MENDESVEILEKKKNLWIIRNARLRDFSSNPIELKARMEYGRRWPGPAFIDPNDRKERREKV